MACALFIPECTFLSCLEKAPRALSGWHASTPESECFWEKLRCRRFTRRGPIRLYPWVRWNVHISANICRGHICEYDGFKQRGKRKCKMEIFSCHSGEKTPEILHAVTEETLWEDLKPAISYLSPLQLKRVRSALKLAFEAHDGQKRKSGEPFIIHPVEVARILGELELDWETLAAGLLHDTVEDTELVTFEQIEEEFGHAVRRIVEGETKVSKLGKLQCASSDTLSHDVKADDLRQMFLAMTEEVRVIIVKLADRLHNMRTLMHMPPHKQKYIASETLQVFAPLAKLLGMYRIKSELEDLSFMYSHPDAYSDLKKRVEEVYNEHEEEALEARRFLLERIADDQFLSFMAVDVKAHALCKELYSIYKKLLECKGSIDEVRDIAQLRIILTPKPHARVGPLCNPGQICYHVLGLTHQMWSPVPQSMKDYIATPKPNGYQSLHTKVLPFLYENTFRLEIQIRTEDMDILAERGIAAHYSGRTSCISSSTTEPGSLKGSTNFMNNVDLARRVSWLNAIREWQEEFVGNMSAQEFVDTVTGDLLGSRVFVFTPKGEIKNLPKGATVIDYAYQIHTDLGNNMVAAKVNGNLVSPTHTLANAEVVEVITYNGLSIKSVFHRHRQWLQHAKTRSARHKITKFLKEQAALVADEITFDSVREFVSELDEVDKNLLADWGAGSAAEIGFNRELLDSGPSSLPFKELSIRASKVNRSFFPQVNGKANKKMEEIAVSLIGNSKLMSNCVAGSLPKSAARNILVPKDVLASLQIWQAGKVALWHGSEDQSIQWLSVLCFDRKSILAEVTSVLGAAGILICACSAETDRNRGLGIMLFHVDGSTKNLMSACASVSSIEGVISWSTGCSWQKQEASSQYL
eukprot:c22008_g1_i1 orf=436-3033(+)